MAGRGNLLSCTHLAGKAGHGLDLSRFFGIVLRWSWLILLLGVAAGVTAYFVSQSQPREYGSEAIVLVGSLTDTDLQQQLAYQQLAQTYATMATTLPVLERVQKRLGLPGEPGDLRSRIAVRTRVGQNFVLINGSAESGPEAADLANAVADEVTGFARSTAGEPGLAAVIQEAEEPIDSSSPKVLTNTAVAAAFGLVIGLGIALVVSESRRSKRLDSYAPGAAAGSR